MIDVGEDVCGSGVADERLRHRDLEAVPVGRPGVVQGADKGLAGAAGVEACDTVSAEIDVVFGADRVAENLVARCRVEVGVEPDGGARSDGAAVVPDPEDEIGGLYVAVERKARDRPIVEPLCRRPVGQRTVDSYGGNSGLSCLAGTAANCTRRVWRRERGTCQER